MKNFKIELFTSYCIILLLLGVEQSSTSSSSSSSQPVKVLQFKVFLHGYEQLTHGQTCEFKLDFRSSLHGPVTGVYSQTTGDIQKSFTAKKNTPLELSYSFGGPINRAALMSVYWVGKKGTLTVTSHTENGEVVEQKTIAVTDVYGSKSRKDALCVELRKP